MADDCQDQGNESQRWSWKTAKIHLARSYMTATTVFVDAGIMHISPGL
jgi:hypothetical protein